MAKFIPKTYGLLIAHLPGVIAELIADYIMASGSYEHCADQEGNDGRIFLLHIAISHDDESAISMLIDIGIDFNASELYRLAWNRPVFDQIIEHPRFCSWTALLVAMIKDESYVKRAIANGAYATDCFWRACTQGEISIAKLLYDNGARRCSFHSTDAQNPIHCDCLLTPLLRK